MSKFQNNQEDLNEIRKGFEMFDVENNGKIDPFELKRTMEEMNLKDKNPFIYELISSLCYKKDNKSKSGITSDEFISFLQSNISDVESKKGIKTIFDVFSDIDDKIPMPTFYQTAREVGDEEGGTEIRDLVEKSQTSGKEIDFDEFYEIMKEKKPKIKYSKSQSSFKIRKDYNNRSTNRSGKKNNEYDNDYEYQYNNYTEKPKNTIKYVEKIVTEQINNNPAKVVDKYNYIAKVGRNKNGEGNIVSYSDNKKRIENFMNNKNKNESVEIKRYHRTRKENIITTTTTTKTTQSNNVINVDLSPNMSLYYSTYKKTE